MSTMILKKVQLMEIVVRQNGLNQPGVENFPIRFVLGISGYAIKGIITHDT